MNQYIYEYGPAPGNIYESHEIYMNIMKFIIQKVRAPSARVFSKEYGTFHIIYPASPLWFQVCASHYALSTYYYRLDAMPQAFFLKNIKNHFSDSPTGIGKS
jgi:hypothetical protein